MSIILSRRNRDKDRRGLGRINPLEVLPVFFKLHNKSVLIAGGSEAAAWKAELLAAAGAKVTVQANELCGEFEGLMSTSPFTDAFTHEKRAWGEDSFKLRQLAICDAESDGEAQAFYCAARAAGVPVNVIDRPDFCEFQFGSIVNRSPVVISISTGGVAPILGQAIRRRIEFLIPQFIADWARIGKSVRHFVNESLRPGQQRRRFWENFVDRAFNGPPLNKEPEDLVSIVENCRHSALLQEGRVTLVGAGPGDAELLTIKAVRALQSADMIFFDPHVSTDVLELSRREAKRTLVRGAEELGGGNLDNLPDMMIKLVRSGKHVVRLHVGDLISASKIDREMVTLQAANVAIDIVPGVASKPSIDLAEILSPHRCEPIASLPPAGLQQAEKALAPALTLVR